MSIPHEGTLFAPSGHLKIAHRFDGGRASVSPGGAVGREGFVAPPINRWAFFGGLSDHPGGRSGGGFPPHFIRKSACSPGHEFASAITTDFRERHASIIRSPFALLPSLS